MHKHLVESRDPLRNRKVTGIMLLLLMIGFFIQFMGSIYARSSGVMSDSFHMLVDGSSQLTYWMVLTIAVWGTQTPKWLRKRFPQSPEWLGRVETSILWRIGDFASTLLLFGAAVTSIFLSLHGLAYPQEVHAEVSFGVGVIGLIVNLINLLVILSSNTQGDLKGVFLHVKSDLYHSIIVIIGQGIVWTCGQNFRFIDSLLGLWLGAKMTQWAWDFLKELLQEQVFHVKGIIIQFPAYEGHNCTGHGHSKEKKMTSHGCNHTHPDEKKMSCGSDHTHSDEKNTSCGSDHTHSDEKKMSCGSDHTHSDEKKTTCECNHSQTE